MARKTVFLDRDGVINQRIMDYWVRDAAEFTLLPGVVEAIVALNAAGYRTVVVTNQRGLAIGRLTWDQLNSVHTYLRETVAAAGGDLNHIYVCPHDRDEGCSCRKPQPGLLDAAHGDDAVDWAASFLVGDRDSDIGAGKARGVTTFKVAGPSRLGADYEVADLPAAVAEILARG